MYKTKDSQFAIVGRWDRFCKSIGKEEWITDPNLGQNEYRVNHYDEVEKLVEEVTRTKTTDEWLKIFKENEIPANRVNTMEEGLNDPGVLATQMIRQIKHTKAGLIQIMDKPWQMSKTNGELRYAPPVFGEHSTEILLEFGFTQSEIDALKQKEAIYGKYQTPEGI